MKKLFLLKPGFRDVNLNPENIYFCPNCALIEGILSYYPQLKDEIEVTRVDFPRPRPAIIELVGEENQSCPVLVHEDGTFINETKDIISYLVEKYHIAKPH